MLDWADYYALIFLAPFLALEFFKKNRASRGWRARGARLELAVAPRPPGTRGTPSRGRLL